MERRRGACYAFAMLAPRPLDGARARGALAVLAFATAATMAGNARGQATLLTSLGGTVGFGSDCLPPNDDGSYPATGTGLDITPGFPAGLHFYSGTYTALWINNNGNISFNSSLSSFTPDAFPGAAQPMIAPYWADVDTRGVGCSATGDVCLDPTTNGVWWSLTPGQLVVTWDQVGFFECHASPVMSFQLILTAAPSCVAADAGGGTDFDIEFRYAECGWEVGDASGGEDGFCPTGTVGTSCTPAQAGFDSAETPDLDYASLPGSRMAGISTALCTGSNLTPPQAGVWQFLVRGGAIMCPAAGQACSTGLQGVCAAGTTECTTGGTTCHQLTQPSAEVCNGLDDNCNGKVDDGATCPNGQVCSRGRCVPTCSASGEAFEPCPSPLVCSSTGVCVEPDCLNVTCADGGVCSDGTCKGPCVGIVCPAPTVCREGTCVDPCAGLTCQSGQVCDDGVCVASCSCAGCSATETCTTSGLCVVKACAELSCSGGDVCDGGACVDPCKGAVCPAGQTCTKGACVDEPAPDGGADAGKAISFGDASLGQPASTSDAAAIDATMDTGSASTDSDDGGGGIASTPAGCTCRQAHATPAEGDEGLTAAIALAACAASRRLRRSGRPWPLRRSARAPSA
jgi:hypothetical protein